MKIATIGGSATLGLYIERKDTWPQQLAAICDEAGWRVSVENRASSGLSLSAFAERVLHLERKDPYDLYLFQIPLPGRIYIGVNGTRRMREEDYGKEMIFGWSALNGYVSPTRLNLSRGILHENHPFHKYLKSFSFSIIHRNSPSATYEEFIAFARFWETNICESDLEFISYAKEVFLLQQILRNLQKPCLMFQWNGRCLRNLAHRTEPFYSMIDWTEFAFKGEKTVIDYLKDSHTGRYPELVIDNLGHLTPAGNRVVAEELVFPEILRWRPLTS